MNRNNYTVTYIEAEAENGAIYFHHDINYFNEHYYSVGNILNDECRVFEFSIFDEIEQKKAYEKAARFYNSLVSENDLIPLF